MKNLKLILASFLSVIAIACGDKGGGGGGGGSTTAVTPNSNTIACNGWYVQTLASGMQRYVSCYTIQSYSSYGYYGGYNNYGIPGYNYNNSAYPNMGYPNTNNGYYGYGNCSGLTLLETYTNRTVVCM